MLLLAEGQAGETSEPSKKTMLFRKFGSTGQKIAFTFGSSVTQRFNDLSKNIIAFIVRVIHPVIILGLPDLGDEGSTILRNVEKRSPNDAASHCRIGCSAAPF